MKNNKISVGIVGASAKYGWAKYAHMPALLAMPEYEVEAICTTNLTTAQESADHYGIKKAYGDYEDLIADTNIQMIDVCVRAPMHFPIVMAALTAGKHVYCEWPLGINAIQADQMASLAKDKGLSTMVGLQARCAPSIRYVHQLVNEGYLGRLLSVNMSMFTPGLLLPKPEGSVWSAPKEAGAHVLSIGMGHALDVLLWCFGELDNVNSVITTQVPTWSIKNTDRSVDVTSPDNVIISGHLKNGATMSAHVANIPWHGTGFRMEAYGTESTIIVTSDQMVEMTNPTIMSGKSDNKELTTMNVPEEFMAIPGNIPQGIATNIGRMFYRLSEGILRGSEVSPDFTEAAYRHHILDDIQRAYDKSSTLDIK